MLTLPSGTVTLLEIGGKVLGVEDNISKKWRYSVKHAISEYEKMFGSSKIIYLLGAKGDGPEVEVRKMNVQLSELSELLGVQLDVGVVLHKADMFLEPQLNRRTQILGDPYDPVKYRKMWGIDSSLGNTDAPSQELYKAALANVQERVDKFTTLKPRPRVDALTSVFGGPFYYGNLVDMVCNPSPTRYYTSVGISKSGKSTLGMALCGNLGGMFIPVELQILGKTAGRRPPPHEILGYILEVNRAKNIQLVQHPLYGNEHTIYEDFAFTPKQLKKFSMDPIQVANYEGTGVKRGPFYRIKQ